MQLFKLGTAATAVAAALGVGLLAAPAHAELIVGLTTGQSLVTFDSATPGTTTAPVVITGQIAGDTFVGIDRRPSLGSNNGFLYGLTVNGSVGRLYTINTTTGVATLASTLDTGLSSSSSTGYGIDFNPTVDRLRVVNILEQNLRVNVDTGVAITDGLLAYAAGDPNFGVNPNVVAAAYSNNFGGATTTVLRDLDSSLNLLATQAPPNAGTLNTQAGAFPDFTDPAGYDISGLSGTPYASFILTGQGTSGFYTIGAGGATLVGTVGTGIALLDIAAPVGNQVFAVPEPGTLSLLGLSALGLLAARRKKRTA